MGQGSPSYVKLEVEHVIRQHVIRQISTRDSSNLNTWFFKSQHVILQISTRDSSSEMDLTREIVPIFTIKSTRFYQFLPFIYLKLFNFNL